MTTVRERVTLVPLGRGFPVDGEEVEVEDIGEGSETNTVEVRKPSLTRTGLMASVIVPAVSLCYDVDGMAW